MRLSTSPRLVLLLIMAWMVDSAPLTGTDTVTAFRSTVYKYVVQYPSVWYREATQPADVLDIASFPLSRAVHATHLPVGGAEIYLAPIEAVQRRERPRTLEEWIEIDNGAHGGGPTHPVEIQSSDGRMSAIEVRSQCCGGHLGLDFVSWYFRFEGRAFVASLSYRGGDPEGKFLDTLRAVVRSLRLTSGQGAGDRR